jgi:hypothetical protein
MRSIHGLRNFLAQFREQLCDDAVSRNPLTIFCFEKLFSDDSLGIDKEISGARKSFLHPGSLGIENFISGDGLRVRVAEQRVVDLVPVGKKLQDFFRVVADGSKLDPVLFESRRCVLQLDQLPFAERSPVGGAKEKKNRTLFAFQRIQRLYPRKLVSQ